MKAPDAEGISFVVPCYNAGDYVLEAVESLVRQPLRLPYEIVLVDDGSDDQPTLRAVRACARHPQVRVLRLAGRSGHHAARNTGIGAARFDFVMQLDADDRLSTQPELLAAGTYPDIAVRMLREDPGTAFVHTMSRMFGDFDGLTISSYPCRDDLVMRKHHVPTSIVYRRTEAIDGGLYDPRVLKWGDWAFAVNLLAGRFRRGLQNRIAYVPGAFHEYRIHSRGSRVSQADVSEFDMTLLVVTANLDLFRHHLGTDGTAQGIARDVVARKPSRLEDLLHMAAFDVRQALTVARQRGFSLVNPQESLGIP